MNAKPRKTECSGLEWSQFLYLIDRLKREKEYRFMLLVGVGCYCGLRIGDILGLRWNVLLENENADITEQKTGKARTITINVALRELAEYSFGELPSENKRMKKAGLIFVNRWGDKLSIQYVNRKLHRLLSRHKIKVKNGSSHCLRKTFGKRVYEMNNKSEASLILLSKVFNHSSTSITRRYIGIQDEEIENVYLNL